MKKLLLFGLAVVGGVAFALLFVHLSSEGEKCGDLPCPVIEIPKAELEGAFGDQEKLKATAGITLHFEEGRFAGFELTRVEPGSLVERIGLRPGDVIHGVGGVALESPDAAMAAYDALRSKSEAEVQMERGGRTHRFTIRAK